MELLNSFNFKVWVGTTQMAFMRVSGLTGTRGEYVWNEITETVTARKLPDTMTFGDITFHNGVAVGLHGMEDWFQQVTDDLSQGIPIGSVKGRRPLRQMVMVMSDLKGSKEYRREYRIFDAYPKAIRVGDFDAQSNTILVNQIVLGHEGFTTMPLYPD